MTLSPPASPPSKTHQLAPRWLRWIAVSLAFIAFIGLQWGPPIDTAAAGGDKWGHVALYFTVGWLAWDLLPKADRWARAGALAAAGLLVGALMEAGQASIPGRTPDSMDLVADLVGVGLAGAARFVQGSFWPRGRRRLAGSHAQTGSQADSDLGEAGADEAAPAGERR